MKPWRWLLQALCLYAAGTLIGLFSRLFLDVIAGVWIILAAICLLGILTCGFAWWRRLPRAARVRGARYSLLAGLAPATWVLMTAWHEGQWRDALLALPITLAAMAAVLLPFAVLAWQASTQLRCHCTRADTPVPSGRQTAEREARGLSALWPRELGFTGTERSTDYFRRLLSDEAGELTDDPRRRLVSDLSTWELGGPGLPEVLSIDEFSAEHNAWQIVCIDSNAPPTYPFLISRNVDLGDWLTPTSSIRLIRSGPLNLRHVVWMTRSGGIFSAPFRQVHPRLLPPPEEGAPPQPFRIMHP